MRHIRARLLVALLGIAALVAAPTARAVDNGPTQVGEICMQKVFGTPVASSNQLNCTANDIRLSRAISVSPNTCLEGDTFDLTATFEINVTANARYDAGFFFRTDGGGNARGDGVNATGTCSLSGLTTNISPALNLDGGDSCGDLNSGTYNVTFTIPDVSCTDSNGDGFLNLPNCTSWHNNAGTLCSIGNAFDFDPDTKSKCVCDDTFQVPVIVETASLTVVKTASPTSVPEPGADVTYDVSITNEADFVSVELDTIMDDIYGDLGDPANTNVSNNTCTALIGEVLSPGENVTCQFQAPVSGNAGDTVTDTVEACGTQTNTQGQVCGNDDATVTITDVSATPTLSKQATASALATCSLTVDVTYTVGISNPSAFDSLTVNDLTDNQFGDITTVQGNVRSTTCVPDQSSATCEEGGVIAPSGSCSCTFVGRTAGGTVSGSSCTYSHTDTVTAQVTDDDGVSSSPSDGAQVNVSATVGAVLTDPSP